MASAKVGSPILGKPGIDDLGEPIQLGPIDRGLAPVSRRNRKTQHLPDAVTRNPEMQCRRSRTHAVSTGQTDFPVKFHGENTPALPGVRKGKSGRLLRRPQPDHPAATVDEFCTAVLSLEVVIPADVVRLVGCNPAHQTRFCVANDVSVRIAPALSSIHCRVSVPVRARIIALPNFRASDNCSSRAISRHRTSFTHAMPWFDDWE